MYHVKNLETILKLGSNPLIIKANTPLTKTLKKIMRTSDKNIVFVEKANTSQMAGVLAARLYGKKFIWIQGFSNPPSANFLEKLLLSQADKIIAENRKDIKKLTAFGLPKSKIKFVKTKD